MMKKLFCCNLCRTGILSIGSSVIKGKFLKLPTNVSLTDYFTGRLFSGQIKRDSIALIYDGTSRCTFAELEDNSTLLAKAIINELNAQEWSCNNEDGDLVIPFCLGNTEIMIITLFAIIKVGATYLPIDPLTPEENLVRMVASIRPILIITESHEPIVARFQAIGRIAHVVKINKLLEIANKLPSDLNDVIPLEHEKKPWDRTAAIYFSAGASGRRRGVRISHRAILNRIMWQWDLMPFDEDDVACLLTHPIVHTSIPDIFAPLLKGTPLVILNKVNLPKPDYIISSIAEHKVTRLTVSSAVLASILSEIGSSSPQNALDLKGQLSVVRSWLCCGDMLTKDLCSRFFDALPEENEERVVNGKRIPRLVHLYGTTETTADATFDVFHSMKDFESRSTDYQAPLGTPIANTMIYVMSERQTVLPLDAIGQICVSGACLAENYISSDVVGKFLPNQMGRTKEYSRIFRTGDLGRITEDADGVLRLYHEGHSAYIVKVGRKQVDLGTISRAIRNTGLVNDEEIFVFHPERDDQVIVAAVVLKQDVIASDVAHAILTQVEKYCIPEIFPQEFFPTQSDGRVDRFKLMENYKASRKILANTMDWNPLKLSGPQLEAGKVLCEVVALSIGVSIPFVITNFHESFWHLGGNSSNVILTVSRLRGKGYHISLEDFVSCQFLPAIVNLLIKSQGKEDMGIQSLHATWKKYVILPMQGIHKEKVLQILSWAYSETGKFDLYESASYEDFHEYLSNQWSWILPQNLSIVVESKETKEIVAASLNVDANSKPNPKKVPKSMKNAEDLFDKCEENAKTRLTYSNSKGALIEPFMMATSQTMQPGQNTLLVELMLKETIKIGIANSFTRIFILSDTACMRQMCRNVLKCDVLLEFPISSFVASDNTKPFNSSENYYSIMVYSKGLHHFKIEKSKPDINNGRQK